MARKFLLTLVVCFITGATTLMALGLGEIKLNSGLNQPLDAEILLVSVRGETNEQLRGTLASSADFDRSGIDKPYFLTKIRFETQTKPDGSKVLHLTTKDVVKEPFLNFLINLEWPNGRLLREYTLLLDPPIFDEAPKVTVAPAVAEIKPVAKPKKKQTRTVTEKPQWVGELYGPTTSKDTLWGIAAKVRPDRSISMQQAMAAIFESNPKAFMRGNINRLKKGADIRVPDTETFKQISQREALRVIAAHNEDWKSGKASAPKVVMDTSNEESYTQEPEIKDNSSGRLSLAADDSDTGTGGSSASDVMAEEANEVLKQENEVLQDKADSDATRIEQLERLLALKNEQLATMQNREASTENQAIPEPSKIEATKADTAQVTNDVAKVEPKAKAITPKIRRKPAPMSLVDSILSGAYNIYLGIAGGVLLLIILFMMRRKGQDTDYNDAVNEVVNPVEGDTFEEKADEIHEVADDVLEESSDLNFQDTNLETTDSADPIGEADIYIAYGKFEQAEALLISAIDGNPERIELGSKLLECYAEMGDKEKFENQVDLISSAIDSDTELGQYIEELYQTAWPEGELFASEQGVVETAETKDEEVNEPEEDHDEFEDVVVETLAEEQTNDLDISDDELLDSGLEFEDDTEDENLEELPSTEDVFGDIELESNEIDDDIENDSSIELADLDDSEDSDESDDVDTQLDLARAYVEMGDIEGTKEIIEEILSIGTEEQCKAAQEILDSLED